MSAPTAHIPQVTLDHNCIIALEGNADDAEHLRRLITLHNARAICLRVVAVGGAERMDDGAYPNTFFEFSDRLVPIGLGDVEILKPLAYCGMAFCGQCVPGGGEASAVERCIQDVLFPSFPFDDPATLESSALMITLRRNRCDVLTLWCHIWYGGAIFVTSDRNFHKATKKPKLIALGAGAILRPAEAAHVRDVADKVSGMEAR